MSTSEQSAEEIRSSGDSSDIAAFVTIGIVVALVLVLNYLHAARVRRQQEEQERRRRASAAAGLQVALAVLVIQAPLPPLRARYGDRTSESSSVPRETQEPAVAVEELLVCTYLRADGWREATCPVCLSEMEDGETVRVLPVCMHYFHEACVGEWLRGNNTCPLCRGPPAAAARA